MSIQLDIFPQQYLGFTTGFTPPPLEMITDGEVFGANLPYTQNPFVASGNFGVTDYQTTFPGVTNLNTSTVLNGMATPIYNAASPFQGLWFPGQWVRYRCDQNGQSGTGPQPHNVYDDRLFMQSDTTIDSSTLFGVGYKFGYSLTPGLNYTLSVDVALVTGGRLKLVHIPYEPNAQTVALPTSYPNDYPKFNQNTGSSINSIFGSALTDTTYTLTFTAVGNSDCIWVMYQGGDVEQIQINSISCIEAGTEVEETIVGDGVVIADLYEDEDIPLTLSVDDFKNVAEKVQSYSKAFKLPSTKRNSQLFDNIFEITRTANGTLAFNPYIKTQCRLKEDGFVLFEGYLRMIDIIDKEGEISYNVNLYSEAVALADILSEKTFNDLDFNELEHAYGWESIKQSWTMTGVTYINSPGLGAFRSATTVKYPFVDWTHQFTPLILPSDPYDGFPMLENLQTAFRPFINIKYLIDRIFNASPFEYTSNFFNTSDFQKLYMDFNWGNDDAPITATEDGVATYLSNIGRFNAPADGDPTNYATTSWTNFRFYTDNFPPVFGWDSATYKFTIPAGFTGMTFDGVPDIHISTRKTTIVHFRWIKNEGLSTEEIFNVQSFAVTGAAVVTPRVQAVGNPTASIPQNGGIQSYYIWEGGYYTSLPTAEVVPNPSGVSTPNSVNPLEPEPDPWSGTVITGMDNGGFGNGNGYFNNVNYRVEVNGVNPHSTYSSPVQMNLTAGDTVAFQWKADEANCVRQRDLGSFRQWGNAYTGGSFTNSFQRYEPVNSTLNCTINYVGTIDDAKLKALRGETEQWGFLKGIINMFNLITVPNKNNPNNITIEPYKDIFIDNADIVEHDWTDKVDVSQIKLTPLTDLNQKTLFKFVEDEDDYPFMNYKKAASGFLYGSRLFDASGFTILGGEPEEIEADPFAATVCKPMMKQYPNLIVPQVYALDDEGASEGFENAPRIMYDNGTKSISPLKYKVPAQNNQALEWYEWFLQFSHLSDIQTVVSNPPSIADTRDFHFGPCQLIGLGSSPTNTLFSTYWQPYFGELYNADTRVMSIKVKLSAGDINTFNMFDKVFIKNRTFRVNKIDYKPGDLSTVEFILIP